MTAPFKLCSCCGKVFTRKQWRELLFVGLQDFPGEPLLELRNCDCGSTLAIERARAA